MDNCAAIEFESITKIYTPAWLRRRPITALADVSLRVEPGEVFALLGPNRAGKTTLVKILLTLCRPTSGRAFRLGRPASERATLARVGYVHENQAFPRYLKAADLLAYYGALALVPYEEVRRRVPALLARVGLEDRAREPIAHFSKGMVQRLSIAQALMNDPDLLVLDEPNEGLDLDGRKLVRELVLEQRRQGKTVLLVSHVLSEVEQVCDRLGILIGGRLVLCGPASTLRRDPRSGTERRLEQAVQELYESYRP